MTLAISRGYRYAGARTGNGWRIRHETCNFVHFLHSSPYRKPVQLTYYGREMVALVFADNRLDTLRGLPHKSDSVRNMG